MSVTSYVASQDYIRLAELETRTTAVESNIASLGTAVAVDGVFPAFSTEAEAKRENGTAESFTTSAGATHYIPSNSPTVEFGTEGNFGIAGELVTFASRVIGTEFKEANMVRCSEIPSSYYCLCVC